MLPTTRLVPLRDTSLDRHGTGALYRIAAMTTLLECHRVVRQLAELPDDERREVVCAADETAAQGRNTLSWTMWDAARGVVSLGGMPSTTVTGFAMGCRVVIVAQLDAADPLAGRAQAHAARLRDERLSLILLDVLVGEAVSVFCRRARARRALTPDIQKILATVRSWFDAESLGCAGSKAVYEFDSRYHRRTPWTAPPFAGPGFDREDGRTPPAVLGPIGASRTSGSSTG